MAYTSEQYLEAAAKAEAAGDVGAAEELRALAASVEPPTQRLRAIGQGLTFGFGDEILAGLQAPFGEGSLSENYGKALQAERDVLKQYKHDYPYSSIGWEMGGAVLPTVLSGGLGGAATAARGAGIMAGLTRGLTTGALTGGAYGFGTGEGDLTDRAVNAMLGAGFGSIGGGLIGAAGGVLKSAAGPLVNWVRNKAGNRMAGAVANALQRMAEEKGLTADEIVSGVASGRIMAENRTLDSMIRKFYIEATGEASGILKEGLSKRPGATRKAAEEELQGALGSPGNPLEKQRATAAAAKEAEDALYNQAFAPSGVELAAPDVVVEQIRAIAANAPEALKNAAEVARVKYGIKPFFKVTEDGAIEFARKPTLREAELIQRSLGDLKGAAYTGGKGTLGEAYGEAQNVFRAGLNEASPDLMAARAQAKAIRDARDAFKAGQEAFRKTPDELSIIIKDVEALGPDAIAAYREGMLTSLRGQMSKPSAAPGIVRNLTNPDTGPGTALRMVLPEDAATAVTNKLKVAEDAQATADFVLKGSPTSNTMLAPSIDNMANTASDAVSVMANADVFAAARLLGGLMNRAKPGLSDAQKAEVARVLISEDPALVRRALTDDTVMGQLMAATSKAVDKVLAATAAAQRPAGLNLLIDNPSGND